MNTHIEKVKEEFTNYKENNEIENRKKNIEILQLINEENETLRKSMEVSLNNVIINSYIYIYMPLSF